MRKLLIVLLILSAGVLAGEMRTYRQIRDVAARQNGKVKTSRAKGDLFEVTYEIDREKGTVIRRHIRRLDKEQGRNSQKKYTIVERKYVLHSKAGGGGGAIVAVNDTVGELILLGDTFAFTSRTSAFAQMITGVYERVK
ncbi:MAG: hypothetical protein LBD99_03635 [Candidatus Margulisbacteria bacterium]|jgi:hypothetical protein|nr:hypothetical protein [Candidatus Margulisiibacteriota bacterium]